ncbi:MAG TPA: hypothetical protein VN426_07020 [Syntrophomonadaceae bacterium]|nr:hypothetical protein [Syntrophomonadaceae bacterium]
MKPVQQKEKIIDFLIAYPDVVLFPQEKARIVCNIKKELRRKHGHRPNIVEIIFPLLFLVVALLLANISGLFPVITGVPLLDQVDTVDFLRRALLYVFIAGALTTPLLLTILPLNKGRKW